MQHSVLAASGSWVMLTVVLGSMCKKVRRNTIVRYGTCVLLWCLLGSGDVRWHRVRLLAVRQHFSRGVRFLGGHGMAMDSGHRVRLSVATFTACVQREVCNDQQGIGIATPHTAKLQRIPHASKVQPSHPCAVVYLWYYRHKQYYVIVHHKAGTGAVAACSDKLFCSISGETFYIYLRSITFAC